MILFILIYITVHGSTFLKNKRIAPTGFMDYFLPADNKKRS
jgi:hypothetical protein